MVESRDFRLRGNDEMREQGVGKLVRKISIPLKKLATLRALIIKIKKFKQVHE